MSHLHIPDGVLPWWLVVAGWVATFMALWLSSRAMRERDLRRKVPLVGAFGALMLVGMSSEIVPIAYHINLSAIAGIVLGPWLAFPTAFVVVSMLALIGHGGVTVIGLNTLVIAAEIALAAVLFRVLVRVAGRAHAGACSAATTVLSLALSTTLVIGIVALAGPLAASRESGAFDPQELRFENPFAGGLLSVGLLGGGHDHGEEVHEVGEADEHHDEGGKVAGHPDATGEADEHHDEASDAHGHQAQAASLDLTRFALMLYGLGSLGWLIEALVTAGIVRFIARVRPSLVAVGLPPLEHRPPGDEAVHH